MLTCLQEGDDNDFGGCKILRAVPLRYKVDDNTRDEDPEFFSTDPDPAQLKKKSGSGSGSDSGSELKSK